MPLALHRADEQFCVTTPAHRVDSFRVRELIPDELIANLLHLGEMFRLWNSRHFDHPISQFVEIAFRCDGLVEVVEAHAPAVVFGTTEFVFSPL